MKYYLDANIFLRLLLKDNAQQYASAYKLIESAIGNPQITLYSSSLVFFEVNWVLKSVYAKSKIEILPFLHETIGFHSIHFSEKKILQKTLQLFENHSLSIEDCYHLAHAQHANCDQVATFDKKMKRISKQLFTN